jgi:hypothetical protein
MNKKNVLLIALFTISATQNALPAGFDNKDQSQKGWQPLCKSYATSLISGGAIGSITGLLSIHTLKKSIMFADSITKKHRHEVSQVSSFFTFGVIVPILVLISEYKLRSTLVTDINQNFQENEIKHNQNLLRDTAWIASWIAFLSATI